MTRTLTQERERGLRRILVAAPLFPPAFLGGGPIRTLDALVSQAPARFNVRVITRDRDLGAHERLPIATNRWVRVGTTYIYYGSANRLWRLLGGYRAARREHPDVLYLNSFFDPALSILPQILGLFGYWRRCVRLMAPRGEFGAGALERRSLKKRMYIRLYRILQLDRGMYWHASSESEAKDIVSLWGERAKVLVRSNETSLPEEPLPVSEQDFEGRVRGVFLGRLVEHKGLLIALKGLAKVERPFSLDVYGPEEDEAYSSECKSVAGKLPANISVKFLGPLPHHKVRETLNRYDVLLMPTAGENFAHVIAESLSASCPVIATELTPWSAVLRTGAGAVVADRSVESWSAALNECAGRSPSGLREARMSAGNAYRNWRSRSQERHIFELLEQAVFDWTELRAPAA